MPRTRRKKKPVRAFISYSHDTPEHSKRVLELAWALRGHGIAVELDQFHNEEIIDWPRWCNEQTCRAHCDFVLCVCTAEYCRRIEGNVPPEKGKGVYWEGSLLDDDIYDAKGNRRIVPLLFDNEAESSIPRFLRGWTYCRLQDFALTDEGYEHVLRILTGQMRVLKNELGSIPILPTESTPARPAGIPVDISRIIKYAPAELIGREAQTKLLSDAWEKATRGEPERPHVLTFVALGGEGKTALVAKWAAGLAHKDWPGCDTAFAWSFYSQGTREQHAASSDTFLKEALTFFGDPVLAGSAQGAFEKGRRLAQLVGERRALLILDGVEPLQYAPTSPTPGEFKDQGVSALLKGLAGSSHGLCIVTTRYSIADLRAYWQATAPEVKLTCLSTPAGVALLKRLGVRGNPKEFEALVADVKGHALTLSLLGTYLRDAHAGDIRRRDLVKLEEADAEEQGGHAFRVMDAYVKSFEAGGKTAEESERAQRALAMLSLLGLFDRPATADCLEALWKGDAIAGLTDVLVGVSEAQRNVVLSRLEEARLLTVNRDAANQLLCLDAHPLIREYFARWLRQRPELWRAAHRRLYEHLCQTTTDKKPNPTLEDLQPLYQAVAHGCQAGSQQEVYDGVYIARINHGMDDRGFYAKRKLGAFGSELGAVACFFEIPWTRVSSSFGRPAQAWLLNDAATCLRALGRPTEALSPMRAGLEGYVKQERWKYAAILAGNLSELELTLGEVARAVRDAEQSVTYSDRSGDVHRIGTRTAVGNALHQAGQRDEALRHFREAEELQAELQPGCTLLYSQRGFQYCDQLLAAPERAAWGEMQKVEGRMKREDVVAMCRAVSQRAAQTLAASEAYPGTPVLDIALDHLTLGRAALYEAILEKSEIRDSESEIQKAVSGLRHAGQQNYIPPGLLTRAWLRLLTGARTGPESAQSDLDEAWEIAERGSMRLFLADIHLYRARLFHGVTPYPWDKDEQGKPRGPKDDLVAARKLIEQCGYGRRKEELEDAEEAAKSW